MNKRIFGMAPGGRMSLDRVSIKAARRYQSNRFQKADIQYLDYPKPRKKQTNADRIRAMTDEELASALMCQPDQWPDGVPCAEANCIKCTLNWLKQEVSE